MVSEPQAGQARVGVRRWQDKQFPVWGVVPGNQAGQSWLPAMFGPQAGCVGGEGGQRIWGVTPWFLLPRPAGREDRPGLASAQAHSDLLLVPPFLSAGSREKEGQVGCRAGVFHNLAPGPLCVTD